MTFLQSAKGAPRKVIFTCTKCWPIHDSNERRTPIFIYFAHIDLHWTFHCGQNIFSRSSRPFSSIRISFHCLSGGLRVNKKKGHRGRKKDILFSKANKTVLHLRQRSYCSSAKQMQKYTPLFQRVLPPGSTTWLNFALRIRFCLM